jgi:hypothetical protein
MEALPPLLSRDGKCPYANIWENPLQVLGGWVDQFKIIIVEVQLNPNAAAQKS